jgi:serine/threonine-protein kinase
MSNSPPTTLGQYQIIREIARSNDIVYEAYDPLMNRRVAVKELAMPAGMTDAQKRDRVSRFKREAQAAGTLNHPNIMTVYSFAEDAGRTFMAMEFLDGHTLRNEIDTKGFLPPERATEIAIAILEGLSHAHAKGVIHRDIKPDNIQLLSNGTVKITDFGIARLTFQPNLTMDGQVFGTPSYMSPEQVVGKDIDARSDLFSVAVVLYEMLSGQKPFPGDSVVAITYAIMNKEPQQPTQCDWAMWQVVQRALDKSPQLRYNSATEMVDALKGARAQAGSASPQSGMSGFNANHPNNPPNVYTSPYANPTAGYSALNRGAPTPPPTPAPQTPAGPYIQQPYNPYAPAPPAPPPPQYGYNPYGSGQPQAPPAYGQPYGGTPGPGQPYGAPGANNPYGVAMPPTLPVYYPPPPRAPLVKPETVVFLKKLAVAFVILGTLAAVLVVGVQSCALAMNASNRAGEDARVAQNIRNLDGRVPVNERIEKAGEMITKLPSNNRAQSQQAMADLLNEKAKRDLESGQAPAAEDSLRNSFTLDPHNIDALVTMAQLYSNRARSASPVDRVELLEQSGEHWRRASMQTPNPTTRRTYAESAARAYLDAAASLFQANPSQSSSVRDLLYSAREAAPPDSPIIGQVENWLAQLRGRTP